MMRGGQKTRTPKGPQKTPQNTPGDGSGGPGGTDGDGGTPNNPHKKNTADKCDASELILSPLVLDLDGDGIELTDLHSANSVYWDIDQDGFAEASGWVASDDALLAIDISGDGIINDHSELFGNESTPGFEMLASYDSNGDNIISQEDAVWSELLVWQDENNNGYSEVYELKTLDSIGIQSINLAATDINSEISGNPILQSSTYTILTTNGIEAREIVDAWFKYSDLNTVYDEPYDLIPEAYELPSLSGYGILPDLAIAISLDANGVDPNSLYSLVKALADKPIEDLFVANNDILSQVRAIMYRWGGVDDVLNGTRGSAVDAQQLGFLESFTGQPFYQYGWLANPYLHAGRNLTQAFEIIQNDTYALLMSQTAAVDLFEGEIFYNIYLDRMEGITNLNLTTLNNLQSEANLLSTGGEKLVFWQNVVRLIEYAYGVDELSGSDESALASAISASGVSDTVSDILESLITGYVFNTITGTNGSDTLTGASLNDTIVGADGNDVLAGAAGNDEINAGNDNDTLTGGAGTDLLIGWSGNDVYKYYSGDGSDVVSDTSGTDKITFGPGIFLAHLNFTRVGNDLQIDIDDGTATGQIYITGQFISNNNIDTIEFNDTSTLSLSSISYIVNGTANGETIQGVVSGGGIDDIINGNGGNDKIYGLTGNDTLHGNDGHDTVEGSAGNDVIYGDAGNDRLSGSSGDDKVYGGDGNDTIFSGPGANTLDGGAGNDLIYGGNGADRYEYSGGNDVIREGGGTDSIYLSAGFLEANVHYYRIGNDLKIQFSSTDSITIKNFHAGRGYQVETLSFNGGSTVALNSVLMFLQGDESANTISGGSAADEIFGFASNDTLDGGGWQR